MGIRFHKAFPLTKLLRLNLSKSGPSISLGEPGAGINFGPRGLRTTVGAPGTGFSFISTGRKMLTLILAIAVVGFLIWQALNPPPPSSHSRTHAAHARHVDSDE